VRTDALRTRIPTSAPKPEKVEAAPISQLRAAHFHQQDAGSDSQQEA
jgi:hypothetical protein